MLLSVKLLPIYRCYLYIYKQFTFQIPLNVQNILSQILDSIIIQFKNGFFSHEFGLL